MFRQKIIMQSNVPSMDDQPLFLIRKDYSGGMNTREDPQSIGENQATNLDNVDISVMGQRVKRLGSDFIASTISLASAPALGGHNFVVQGGTDQMLMYTNDKLYKWEGTANWVDISSHACFSSLMSGATEISFLSAKQSGTVPDDIVVFYNGRNNILRYDSTGTYHDLGNANESPPLTHVMAWYGNRIWGLKNDLFYFSDAYDSDYSTAFDRTSNVYRVPVGKEMAIIPTRDMGMVIFGLEAIWSLAPSVVPAATDQPQLITKSIGCVAGKSAVNIADDIYWLSQDGVRALKRTEQDKLQMHSSNAISYPMKTEFDILSWNYIDKACGVYFDNKYLLAVPANSSTTNNRVWVYYPASNGWSIITNWNVSSWIKYKINGKEELYYTDANTGRVLKAFSGYDDLGVLITYTEEGREEDFGQPMVDKVGGVIEIEAQGSGGTYTIATYASVDGGGYTLLGNINIYSDESPYLPVSLPFSLGGDVVVRQKFHLDVLGVFRTIKLKFVNVDLNTGFVKILGHNITTFPEEYRNENAE